MKPETLLNASDLHIGDIVRLNSGGPEATVTSVNGDKVTIQWRDECEIPSACVRRT